jgi:hypothetical protein
MVKVMGLPGPVGRQSRFDQFAVTLPKLLIVIRHSFLAERPARTAVATLLQQR